MTRQLCFDDGPFDGSIVFVTRSDLWLEHRNAARAPHCHCGSRAQSCERGSGGMSRREDPLNIAQLLPRGQRPQDIADDARARARAGHRSRWQRSRSRSVSLASLPLRTPSVDSESNVSPAARERVISWGRSVASHWAIGRSGRAPSDLVPDADPPAGATYSSAVMNNEAARDNGIDECAVVPTDSLNEASCVLGQQTGNDLRHLVHERSVTEAQTQLDSACGDMVVRDSCARSSRLEEDAVPLETITGPPSDAQSAQRSGVADSDSDSVMVITPPQRHVRGRGRNARRR